MTDDDRRSKPPMRFGIGRALELIYRAVVARRNRRFDALRGVQRAPVPVICIGNLSVGGTGKTPFVMWLIGYLQTKGLTPGIAMRGYKAAPGAMSDEQAEYAARLPGVAVAADANRYNAVCALAAHNDIDIAVLDDGFQHRQLYRDLDIVLLDATRSVFTDRCLPAGWLREPVKSLSRAGLIVWTHSEAVTTETLEQLHAHAKQFAPNVPIVNAAHTWSALETAEGDSQPIDILRSATVAIACGIGNPTAFRSSIEAAGARVIETIIRPDHYAWSTSDLAELKHAATSAGMLVTTDKDWVKLRRFAVQEHIACPIVRPRIVMTLTQGHTELEAAIDHIIDQCSAASSP